MVKYFNKFNNEAEYASASSGLILPNVSLCVNENEVHYNASTPPAPSHDYVEIGGVKWATMNIGATGVTDYGLYFQWGDTQGYTAAQVGVDKTFDWENYKFSIDGSSSDFSKYNNSDGLGVLQASDDAVTAAWGGNWRMPTTEEFQALETATTSAWTSSYEGSGVAGLVLTSNADSNKKIFFPIAGKCSDDTIEDANSGGYYWSSSKDEYDDDTAYRLSLYNDYIGFGSCDNRYIGSTIRGVLDE
jgi:uncharacterized protein (TIGR02145 family)